MMLQTNPPWPVCGNQLTLGNVPLADYATALGSDCFYVYDAQRVTERIAQLRQALPDKIGIHYAIKANPFPALIDLIVPFVDGLDVASLGELHLATQSHMSPKNISYAGPGKTTHDLESALAAGVLINLESTGEAERLSSLCAQSDRCARVAIRVNPAFELRNAGMRMGGGAKPFGIDEEKVPALLDRLPSLGLKFEGFHIYCGSQNLSAEAIANAQRQSYALAQRLAEHAPSPLLSLNLGGGFGIPYFAGDTALNLAPIVETLEKISASAAAQFPQARLHLELGRYLVGEAGLYVTRILDKKISRGETFLITAGGMNHHLAASGNLGQVIRKNYPVAIGNRLDAAERELVNIHGPLCTPLDVLATKVTLPCAEPGDWVVVYQSGAYGASASPQGFLSHAPLREVMVG